MKGSSCFPFRAVVRLIQSKSAPYHVVTSWHPKSGSCTLTCISSIQKPSKYCVSELSLQKVFGAVLITILKDWK